MASITITYEQWKKGTDLGALHRRSSEMEAIDKALKEYHTTNKSERAFIALKNAFDNWIRAQQRDGKAWTDSGRNKFGLVGKLHEQIVLVDAERAIKLLNDPEEMAARKALVQAERDAIKRLFDNRRLVLKHEAWKTKFDKAVNTAVIPGATAAGGLYTGAKQAMGTARVAISPTDVNSLVQNLTGGYTPTALFDMLGTSASQFFQAASSILSAAISPALLLKDLVSAGMRVSERVTVNSARFNFRVGQADAALDAIVRLIDRELALIAIDAAKQVSSIVAHSFAMGPVASAAGAVVDVIVNAKLYAKMAEEIKKGNLLLAEDRYGLELFDASPVLGCYFLVLADTSVWINFSVFDIGTPGWMDTVQKMRKKSEPVIEKAREYIRTTKYALSGTEFMKGLEWEATWRNNKLGYLAQHANFEYLANKAHAKMKGAPARNPKVQVDPRRIYAITMTDRGGGVIV